MKTYSTRRAARLIGISLTSLNRYIAAGKVAVPPVRSITGLKVRVWTAKDVKKLKKQLPRIANGRKKRKKR